MSRRPSPLLFLMILALAAPLWADVPSSTASSHGETGDSMSPFEWEGPLDPAQVIVAECLRDSRRVAPDALEPLVARLLALGDKASGACISILAQGRVPKTSPEDAPQKVSLPQREFLLSTLARLPEADVRAALALMCAGQLDEPRACVAVSVLGAIGTSLDLQRIMRIAPRQADGSFAKTAKATLRAAIARILTRDPLAFDALTPVLDTAAPSGGAAAGKLDEALMQQILLALSDASDVRALRPCLEIARNRPQMAQTALALMPAFANTTDHELRLDTVAWLRSVVNPARVEWTRAVFGALGALDEGDAVAELIEGLDAAEEPLRSSAHQALQRIAGVVMPPDAAAWNAWFDREIRWYRDTRAQARAWLGSHELNHVVSSLSQYAAHRLFRSELAADVVPLLVRPEPGVRELAARTLGEWRTRYAVRDLEAAQSDPVPAVARAARESLERILGPAAVAKAKASSKPAAGSDT